MKKTVLTLIAACAIATASQAQKRNCGIMDYFEFRSQQDPSFEKRMRENERQIQEWIKQHPSHDELERTNVHLPSLEGFQPTGYLIEDRANYEKAKQQYLAAKGSANPQGIVESEKVRSMREQKRKSNSFIQK